MKVLKATPVTIALVACMWAAYAWRGDLGYNLPADVHIWHALTAGITAPNLTSAVVATLAAACFALPAEAKLGSRAFALAAVASQAVAAPICTAFGEVNTRPGHAASSMPSATRCASATKP